MISPETIFALITAPGKAPTSIVRISGTHTLEVLGKIVSNPEKIISKPKYFFLTKIKDPQTGKVVDTALVTYFKAPYSFTGEDVVEVHLHGGSFILKSFFSILTFLRLRPANPGEFSQRAYLNGKIDLTQAEAIADIIDAETESQFRVASEQFEGKLANVIDLLGEPLRNLLAEIEAYIDFPEEGIEPLRYEQWQQPVDEILITLKKYITSFSCGRIIREGAKVIIFGPPNAGKSSLLNQLCGEERAIVTDIPGTTRDTIEEHLSINGLLLRLVDTAGIELLGNRQVDKVEQLGIERSYKKASNADLILVICDPLENLEKQLSFIKEELTKFSATKILVINKLDLLDEHSRLQIESTLKKFSLSKLSFDNLPFNYIFISALNGEGLEELKEKIYQLLASGYSANDLLITNQRHLSSLEEAYHSLENTKQNLIELGSPEIISLELRASLISLSDIIGVTSTDEILGKIFSKFCIGK